MVLRRLEKSPGLIRAFIKAPKLAPHRCMNVSHFFRAGCQVKSNRVWT